MTPEPEGKETSSRLGSGFDDGILIQGVRRWWFDHQVEVVEYGGQRLAGSQVFPTKRDFTPKKGGRHRRIKRSGNARLSRERKDGAFNGHVIHRQRGNRFA